MPLGGTGLPLPFRFPVGGLSFFSPAYPAFGLLSCPLSPSPLPRRGRGRIKVISCKGLRPLHPRGAEPERHLQSQQKQIPGGGRAPGGTCYPCPGGEDHLKRRRRLRRIVPSPPVPPLLGWRRCSPVPRPNRQGFESPCTAVITKGTRFPQEKPMPLPAQPRGCKGRSPLHKITLKLPLPRRGRGSGG